MVNSSAPYIREIRRISDELQQVQSRLAAGRNTLLRDQGRAVLETAKSTPEYHLTPEKIKELQEFRASIAAIPGPDPVDLIREARDERLDRILGVEK